jgi:hypothetical protein
MLRSTHCDYERKFAQADESYPPEEPENIAGLTNNCQGSSTGLITCPAEIVHFPNP